jgi:aminopeptidase
MFLKWYFVAIKMISINHQIPNPPAVISFKIPNPMCPMIKRSTPRVPKKMDITKVKIQLTLRGSRISLLIALFYYNKVCLILWLLKSFKKKGFPMRDPRLTKMAQVIVHYSLNVQPNNLVWMAGEIGGLPLMEALYEQLIKAKAQVKTTLIPAGWDEIFFKHATHEQLTATCPFTLHEASLCDKRIRVIGPTNTRGLSHVEPQKQALALKANQPILSKVLSRSAAGELDWVVTLCPTAAGAQEGNMGIGEYEDFVFRAAHLDEEEPVAYLKQIEEQQQRVIDFLEKKKELHFRTPFGTDLYVNIEGMKWRNSSGKRNYPDGEVFTGPNLKAADGGVNGVVHYTFPAIWQNQVVEGVELTFEKGRVVQATARRNENFLKAMLSQDEGASRLGEIAIGTNYKIQTFTQNILFDEKIGGTFHAALGMGYPETGNTNQSALHWDMICDLREGGTIEADGEMISKEGKFLFPGWPG